MTRYYRYGELDTCEGRWAAIWACMDRSKRYVRARSKEEKYLSCRVCELLAQKLYTTHSDTLSFFSSPTTGTARG